MLQRLLIEKALLWPFSTVLNFPDLRNRHSCIVVFLRVHKILNQEFEQCEEFEYRSEIKKRKTSSDQLKFSCENHKTYTQNELFA